MVFLLVWLFHPSGFRWCNRITILLRKTKDACCRYGFFFFISSPVLRNQHSFALRKKNYVDSTDKLIRFIFQFVFQLSSLSSSSSSFWSTTTTTNVENIIILLLRAQVFQTEFAFFFFFFWFFLLYHLYFFSIIT